MASPPTPKQPLSRERIVSTALALVDAHGLPALTMRRLGAELGMDPMAVYYYMPNKDALLDAVVEAVMADIDLGFDDPQQPPVERLVRAARVYAEQLVRHRNALPLLLVRGPATAPALAPVELMVAILRSAGLSPERAVAGMNAVAATVRGYAAIMAHEISAPGHHDAEMLLALESPEQLPYLSEAAAAGRMNPEAAFEFGIRALATGLLAAQPSDDGEAT